MSDTVTGERGMNLTHGKVIRMIVTEKPSGPQASGMVFKGDFNKLSATGLAEFSAWYKAHSTTIAVEYADASERNETLNEFALWLFQEYPQRVTYLSRQARADELFENVIRCELEDMANDPQSGCAPYMSSATVRENGLERTLDANELEDINEFCAEGVHEWFIERYA
mgnify:CR=1 FL=1